MGLVTGFVSRMRQKSTTEFMSFACRPRSSIKFTATALQGPSPADILSHAAAGGVSGPFDTGMSAMRAHTSSISPVAEPCHVAMDAERHAQVGELLHQHACEAEICPAIPCFLLSTEMHTPAASNKTRRS
mmetsp:Transcript_15421/g.49338  ORF Transcript_15421/g.49338 Transcript_15421/m.49338 type:complete len:130 (+) Transcript_15421:548-937(+)